jgi:hypothetical protein
MRLFSSTHSSHQALVRFSVIAKPLLEAHVVLLREIEVWQRSTARRVRQECMLVVTRDKKAPPTRSCENRQKEWPFPGLNRRPAESALWVLQSVALPAELKSQSWNRRGPFSLSVIRLCLTCVFLFATSTSLPVLLPKAFITSVLHGRLRRAVCGFRPVGLGTDQGSARVTTNLQDCHLSAIDTLLLFLIKPNHG